MEETLRIRGILFFGLKFILWLIVAFVLWWWLIPYYGHGLGWLALKSLNGIFGMDFSEYSVHPQGWLNIDTMLSFDQRLMMPLSMLTKNYPTYLALILATGGLGLWRRARVILYGSLIIMLGHLMYLVLALRFAQSIQESPEIPTALAEFFMIIPFILWVAFAYWDKIMAYISETAGEESE